MTVWRNLIGGIETIEMGDMTVLVFRIIPILQPFLQLTISSYLHRRQLADGLLKFLGISLIFLS